MCIYEFQNTTKQCDFTFWLLTTIVSLVHSNSHHLSKYFIGQIFNYSSWYYRPINAISGQSCAKLLSTERLKWIYSDCHETSGFICEYRKSTTKKSRKVIPPNFIRYRKLLWSFTIIFHRTKKSRVRSRSYGFGTNGDDRRRVWGPWILARALDVGVLLRGRSYSSTYNSHYKHVLC